MLDQQDNGALEAFLQDLGRPDVEVLYAPNLGNAGDSLIALATFQLFRRLGLRWRLLDHRDFHARTDGAIVLYGGGGNLVPFYDGARRFIAAHHRRARRLVLLPHTVRGNEDLLGELGPNVDLIARERPSFDQIRACAPRAHHHLMHDIALDVDLDELRRGSLRLLAAVPPPRAAARLARYGWRRLRHPSPPQGHMLNAFRTDKEATRVARPADNFDLSYRYIDWVAPEGFARAAAREFVAIADRYDEIRTNRLHVAIAGALLGKQVRLHDNSYGKNRAVWEHSLAGRFGNVEWCG